MNSNSKAKVDFPPWPQYEEDEIAAATRVLQSGQVNYWNGEEGRKFEKEFAEYHGVPYAVAVTNGTVALELALYALGIGPGDDVVVTPRSFIASASCIVNSGARPVFADVDRDSGNITAETVRSALTSRTRAIIVVHLGGWPCDMDPLIELAREKGLYVIEDCAQAHGARYKGRPVGSLGHISAFSFCTDKIMTTGGEGGMVLTSDSGLWSRMWSYKDHGKSWDAVYNREHPPGFRWLHESFGTNWRLTEMQSVIGRVQLAKLDRWVKKRHENAGMLIEGLSGIPGLRVPVPEEHVGHAWYKFYAYVEPERLKAGWNRNRIMQAVAEQGIPCMQGICPEIYLERAFCGGDRRSGVGSRTSDVGRRMSDDGGRTSEGGKQRSEVRSQWVSESMSHKSEDRGQTSEVSLRPEERLPVAKELGETSLMFLVHPTLGEREMKETVRVVREIMLE